MYDMTLLEIKYRIGTNVSYEHAPAILYFKNLYFIVIIITFNSHSCTIIVRIWNELSIMWGLQFNKMNSMWRKERIIARKATRKMVFTTVKDEGKRRKKKFFIIHKFSWQSFKKNYITVIHTQKKNLVMCEYMEK